jgi:hypothetical protein
MTEDGSAIFILVTVSDMTTPAKSRVFIDLAIVNLCEERDNLCE